MADEAFARIVVHELAADVEAARLRWMTHRRRCWRRHLLPCEECARLEREFLTRLRGLCNGGIGVILD